MSAADRPARRGPGPHRRRDPRPVHRVRRRLLGRAATASTSSRGTSTPGWPRAAGSGSRSPRSTAAAAAASPTPRSCSTRSPRSGAAMNGCSAVHLTVFGLNPVVKFGNDRLKETFLPRAAAGDLHVAFGVTEPDAGTDTGRITTRAEPDGNGGWRIHGRKIWTTKALESEVVLLIARTGDTDSGLQGPQPVPRRPRPRLRRHPRRSPRSGATRSRRARSRTTACRSRAGDSLGEENEGFRLLLHGLNPERVLLASEACGIGEVALDRAVTYAKERIVFDRPIGANQAISHPLAHAHAQLRAAWMMALHAGPSLRRRPRVRRGGQHRQVPRRRGVVLRRRPRRADPRRHGLRVASTTSSATGARRACSASRRSPRR